MPTYLKCEVENCSNEAKKKCTKCGKVFCELHLRYGNPHFSLGTIRQGVGNYCDDCWSQLEKQGKLERILVPIISAIVFLVAGLIMVSFLQ